MKRLILMRHAKSDWSTPGQSDIDRTLNKRGARNAARMGKWLKAKGYLPDLALVSVAARTRETWSQLALDGSRADFVQALYPGSPEEMLTVLRNAPDVPAVLMLGHQPAIGELAQRLVAEAPADAEFGRYPTAATAIIDFEIDGWRDVGWSGGRLADFAIPKALD